MKKKRIAPLLLLILFFGIIGSLGVYLSYWGVTNDSTVQPVVEDYTPSSGDYYGVPIDGAGTAGGGSAGNGSAGGGSAGGGSAGGGSAGGGSAGGGSAGGGSAGGGSAGGGSDSVGTDCGPPPPTPIPEFYTIAIPVASILGLVFFFNYRKYRK